MTQSPSILSDASDSEVVREKADIQTCSGGLWVTSGRRRVFVPSSSGELSDEVGPMVRWCLDEGEETRGLSLSGGSGLVDTVIERHDCELTRWRTTLKLVEDEVGAGVGKVVWTVTWPVGGDTLLVDETMEGDSDAVLNWRPFGSDAATAYAFGHGRNSGAMVPLNPTDVVDAAQVEHRMGTLGHLSYVNQWQLAWVGFCDGDEPSNKFLGIFTGWGSDWRGEALNRLEVWREGSGDRRVQSNKDATGSQSEPNDPSGQSNQNSQTDFLRLPLRTGRRRWGIVLSTRQEANVDDDGVCCLLNRRKTSCSDLNVAKVATWELDPPLPSRDLNLLAGEDLETMCERVALDHKVARAIEAYAAASGPTYQGYFAVSYCLCDASRMQRAVEEMVAWARELEVELHDGGYERLCIFDGRSVKWRAYNLDVMWATGVIDEASYRTVRRSMLLLAYMFRDSDFVRYKDFWLDKNNPEDADLVRVMAQEMGPCPNPPNFSAEYFTSVGVVAELFPDHPEAQAWRTWTIAMLDSYLEKYYEPDGTYREAINYHNHSLNMLMCYLWPLRVKGIRDYFTDPRIRGSFEHFIAVTTPATDCVISLDGHFECKYPSRIEGVLADPAPIRHAYLNNGNSGSDWQLQVSRGELILGMAVYAESDPQLASQLAWTWRHVGMPMLDTEHTFLTLAVIDPTLEPIEPPRRSVYRQSLGLISRCHTKGDIFAFFRAGSATNHMDFDQGSINLIAHGKVLLGDPGYHASYSDGRDLKPAATQWHNTLIYGNDPALSSGYTGLEEAPQVLHVEINGQYDWGVHRIVNNNHRRLDDMPYNKLLPANPVTHIRRYLFLKQTGVILVEDTWDPITEPCLFMLHPPAQLVTNSHGTLTADAGDGVCLDVCFLHPQRAELMTQQCMGPFWHCALPSDASGRFMTIIAGRQGGEPMTAHLDVDGHGKNNVVHVHHAGHAQAIELPLPSETSSNCTVRNL